jgi:hypothetical protein
LFNFWLNFPRDRAAVKPDGLARGTLASFLRFRG